MTVLRSSETETETEVDQAVEGLVTVAIYQQ